jgi:hypothetical protein
MWSPCHFRALVIEDSEFPVACDSVGVVCRDDQVNVYERVVV